jgi:hypothetical protein
MLRIALTQVQVIVLGDLVGDRERFRIIAFNPPSREAFTGNKPTYGIREVGWIRQRKNSHSACVVVFSNKIQIKNGRVAHYSS